ncbi:MAG TPA: AAA family ATPase [Candidatus Dormibacteraeota bacterium]|nr:AAA family ATPase [Candidatus Dormibacteraeota bacterium]
MSGDPSGERINIPSAALVVLIGAAGSGKSTFASSHFPREAIVSSDQLRAALYAASPGRRRNDVFQQLLPIVETRLEAGRLTVLDATNTDWMRRSELIRSARRHGRPAIALVFQLPVDVCLVHNASRPNAVPASTVRRQAADIARDADRLDLEGFAGVFIFRSVDELSRVRLEIERGPVARASSS